MVAWMVYGANGYTGELVARLAVARGQRPVLAGRDGPALRRLGAALDCPVTVVTLDDPAALRAAVAGVEVVAHCAGPFAHTSAPMVSACLAAGTHYLDVTGEIDVFEAVFARSDAAERAGVALLPGVGFDVVPTDCVAAILHARLPSATELDLAFRVEGGMSRGTLRTSLLGAGGRRRVDGRLVDAPVGTPRRRVEFPSGPRTVSALPWGDLSTAYRSTGIPTITTYTVLPGLGSAPAPLRRAGAALFGLAPVRALADALVRRGRSGPPPEVRASTRAEVWGEVRDGSGASASMAVTVPNAYDLTADSVVRAVALVGGVPAGAHTPSAAFGADYLFALDGVRR